MDINPLAVPDDPTDEFEPLVVDSPTQVASAPVPDIKVRDPFDDGLPPLETGGSD